MIKKIRNLFLSWAKNFILKNIDKNQDGVITPEEILDFVQELINVYENLTDIKLEIKIKRK
jgi:hypothetical protein